MDSSLQKKALRLEYITVGYNLLEGAASIIAGLIASSIALIGFGLDSGIESLSGVILVWRLTRHGLTLDEEEAAERRATRFVAYTFFILGAYVLYESVEKLYFRHIPEPSLFGIIIALLSIITMPALSYAKLKIAREIGSKSLEADSKETLVCALLSVALVIGLGLNYLFGLWWADPIAALVIVAFIIYEGFETLEEGREE